MKVTFESIKTNILFRYYLFFALQIVKITFYSAIKRWDSNKKKNEKKRKENKDMQENYFNGFENKSYHVKTRIRL